MLRRLFDPDKGRDFARGEDDLERRRERDT
jgi:hypothetical protein